jgi:type I restriction enzyme S subunit
MVEQVTNLRTGVKYKDTPIGKIPVDWEVLELGEISDEIYRYPTYYKISYGDENNGVPEIRGELIKENGDFYKDSSKYRYISKETSLKFPRTIVDEGDFVISVRGTLGKIGYIPSRLKNANITANLMRISPNREKVYPLWLKQFFLSNIFQNRLNEASSATTIKTIKAPELRSIRLALPLLPEQQKIADILKTADDAIEKTTQIIDKIKELKKGLMKRLLTRGIGYKKFKQTEIGKIPVDWEIKRLKDLCIGKPEYGANTSAVDKTERLPRYIRITDITEDGKLLDSTWQSIERRFAENYMLKEGDFLFARSGATVGKTYLHKKKEGECAFAGYLIRFKLNPTVFSPDFLFHFTHSQNYYNWVKGMLRAGAQPNINAKEYSNMKVPSPPIKEQKRIVAILNSIDDELEKESKHRDQLILLKKGLMHLLLTGKLRVTVQ